MSLLIVKNCPDFIPLGVGSKSVDERYCDSSFKCKQIGYISHKVKMETKDGVFYELLCTGELVVNEEDKHIDSL